MKKRNLIFIRKVILVFFATLLLAACNVQKNQKGLARFSSSGCAKACWKSIEPGRTDKKQVEKILKRLNIDYDITDNIPGGNMFIYTWNIGEGGGMITVYDDIVIQIALESKLCRFSIVENYDKPEEIYFDTDDNTYFLYTEYGIIFSFDGNNLSRAQAVFLVNDAALRNFQRNTRLFWEDIDHLLKDDCE